MKKIILKIFTALAVIAFLAAFFGCDLFGGDDDDDEEMQISIDSVEPNFFIFGEQVVIALTGSNFTEDLTGTLVNGTARMDYAGEEILSSTRMNMTFAEAGGPAGWWDLLFANSAGQEQNFPDAVEIAEFRIIKSLATNTISIPDDGNYGYDFSADSVVPFDGGSADAYFNRAGDQMEFRSDLDAQGQLGTYYYSTGGDWGTLEDAVGIATNDAYGPIDHTFDPDYHFGTVDINTGYYVVLYIKSIDLVGFELEIDYIIVEKLVTD